MAISDYMISTAEVQAVHVEAQPTILQGSATDNKKAFDAYSDMIVSHFNDLCTFLENDTSATVDRDVLIYYREVLGWVAD